VLFQKLPDRITPMPTCAVNIQPDSIATKPAIKVLQHLEEGISVSAFRLDCSSTAQKRSHPAGDIQALLMLARCRNLQTLSNECPTPAQPWMQGKATFVLKNNSFFRPQRLEFFLGSWRTSSRRRPLLGDRYDRLASTDTQADASSTGPDGLLTLSRTAAVYGSPGLDRPIGRGLVQTSGAIPPDGAQSVQQSSASYEGDDQTVFSEPGLRPRPYLPLVSSGSRSSVSGLEPRRSNLVAAPPALKGEWLSLFRSRLQVLSRPEPATALWIHFQGRFSCLHHNIKPD
jgi:hypothetical protein